MIRKIIAACGLLSLCEAALLVWIAWETRWYVPLLIVVAGIVAGALVLRLAGFQVLGQLGRGQSMFAGPTVIRSIRMLLGAMLLILPGLISDCLALLLLFPPTGNAIENRAKNRLLGRFRGGMEQVAARQARRGYQAGDADDNVVEGTVLGGNLSEDERAKRPRS